MQHNLPQTSTPVLLETWTAKSPARLSPSLNRALEIAPAAVSLFLISFVFWGYLLIPSLAAAAILLFDAYWLWKSWTIGFHARKGVLLIKKTLRRSARRDYERLKAQGVNVLPWDLVKHLVIIPNYQESRETLRRTLRTLAVAKGARESIVPVLAMEGAEPGAFDKATELAGEFEGSFYALIVNVHPAGIPGEVRGKSANESWAARFAAQEMVEGRGLQMSHLTITSCDADTLFHRRYFERLSFEFATNPRRYRTFWQAPIFFYNNIWQVPGPLRVPNALSGLVHLGRLSRRRKVAFAQSTYSLSLAMAHEAGYWDTDVIPEDWHMFLKCYYRFKGEVEVEPIYLPLGNDGALSTSLTRTFANHYLQVRRWGWGVVDLPYVVQEILRRKDMPLKRRLIRGWYFLDNHISWSSQWFFISLGGLIPLLASSWTGTSPAPDWLYIEDWLGGVNVPGKLSLAALFLTPCLIPYVMLIYLDTRLRPRAPAEITRLRRILAFAWWPFIGPITFFTSTLPALDAQVRLMLGRRLEYRVTEKAQLGADQPADWLEGEF